ncbi:hypothetical protein [Streptomyces sp. NPDC058463]|uniref:hypothetical protein n=1 Tax=Streptomyces sp. NPDC058463 TaxID=3346510 RepID=UPI00365B1875
MTVRARERFLGGGFLFAAFLTVVYGFGTAQADGSVGTALIAAALAAVGVWLIRGRRKHG